MVGRVPPLSSPPVVPFRSFPPANFLRACPSGTRASAPSFPQRPIVVRPPAPVNSRWLILLQTLCRRQKTQLLCNQANPNSFAKTRGGGITPEITQTFSVRMVPPWQIHSFQAFAASLPFSPPLALCFQSFAASFPKIPGVGYPECTYGTPGVRGAPSLHRDRLHRRLTRP